MKKISDKFDFDELAKAWPSPLVARREVERFSGGLLKARTMANLDSQGKGPERVRSGGRTAYPARALAAWLRDRSPDCEE
jgi:hypothetical protein